MKSMKRFLVIIALFVLTISLVACNIELGENTDETNNENEQVSYEITYTNLDIYEDSIGSIWVSIISEITNTGTTDLYLSSGSIDLENESKSLVKVLNLVSVYPQIISPGEKGYYYANTTVDNITVNTELTAILHPNVVKSKTNKISFPVTDVSISDREYGGIQAIGRVENTSDKDESLLYVAVVLFDSDDKPIAVLSTIADVKAGNKIGFTATALRLSDDLTASAVKRFVCYAYTFQFQF